jgi:hypothetical protein
MGLGLQSIIILESQKGPLVTERPMSYRTVWYLGISVVVRLISVQHAKNELE